jgi:hypothetical protein
MTVAQGAKSMPRTGGLASPEMPADPLADPGLERCILRPLIAVPRLPVRPLLVLP